MSELQKLQALIDNKRVELNRLYDDRSKINVHIARIEGEVAGLQNAQSAIDSLRAANEATLAQRSKPSGENT